MESISIKFLLGPPNLDYISSFHGLASTFHFALLLLYNYLSAMQLLHVDHHKNKDSLVFIHTGSFFFLGRYDHMLGAQNTPGEGMEANGECV